MWIPSVIILIIFFVVLFLFEYNKSTMRSQHAEEIEKLKEIHKRESEEIFHRYDNRIADLEITIKSLKNENAILRRQGGLALVEEEKEQIEQKLSEAQDQIASLQEEHRQELQLWDADLMQEQKNLFERTCNNLIVINNTLKQLKVDNSVERCIQIQQAFIWPDNDDFVLQELTESESLTDEILTLLDYLE